MTRSAVRAGGRWVHAQIGKEVPPDQVVEADPHGRLFKVYEEDQLETVSRILDPLPTF
jgi:hypothetical protein